ncbi:MAG TPA: DNA polymerase I [Gammaproteobacteria bacterium]|mgnify:FL=1|jgi:DNA polymerase-1|nr:DNA polymerase I [Acidiferrobacteraceae bacterium]MDP6550770.1 DNA polymerase I [Arenicellales bacterium]MDP6791964.1 DNA polymerase I [Arenicellales bacterium]MDP6918648.1 DNA polymerase I [Arenicellales bacterium]HCX86748.1 DNA polymerase I [Gammaproteobacteria bacterium]|tara:strand:+ start:5277 stop:7967 length:2691 start_codon:yes stop_codon:yes gene_type:complete
MSKQLVLVDGSSYLYRAFHAMPNLANSRGEATGAVYGVVNMLRRLLREYDTPYFAVVFDAPGKTFRDRLYSAYKANRPPMPDELRSQIDKVHTVIRALGLPLLSVPDVEADDVIGTLARMATAHGMETLIISGDKDLAQLVDASVRMCDSMKDVVYDAQGVEAKFGVPPERIVDFLALVGDTSDNIPGVPKVGPKTAVRWLKEYGSLGQLVAQADSVSGKVGENLRAALDQLPLSHQLATVKCDVALEQGPADLKVGTPDDDALRQLYAELEFRTWLADLGGLNEADQEDGRDSAQYEIVLDTKVLSRWLKRLSEAPLFAFDTETTSIDAMRARIVGVSFAVAPGEGAYVPLAHDYLDAPQQLNREEVLEALRPLLEDPDQEKVGQNLKYDCTVLSNHGISLAGMRFDTMLESYVLDSTGSRHDMDTLALKYLGHKTISYEEVAGKGKSQLSFNQVPLEQAGPYAAEDAEVTLRLHQLLFERLRQEQGQRELFERIEMPLVPVLSKIERTGVRVDCDMLAAQSAELAERISELEAKAYEEAGAAFNIASPKQIQEILFERLALPVLAKTPKGQPSTAESVLVELAEQHELPRLVLEHRGLSKLRSTYTEKLPTLVNPDTGRVHTSYHQAAVATGRLSSSDPNLQNIPVRTAEGRRIREAFVPAPGMQLIAADYSQIELRIMAHLSADEGLLGAFEKEEDVHRATAAEVFGAAVEEVSADQRRSAKAINFGLIYGMSAFGLARQLGIERGQAQEYIDRYFERYPGVRTFMDTIRARVREQRFVETVFGRRLFLADISSSNHARRQAAERAAINAPMQGTAADLIKLAMLSVDEWLREDNSGACIIMQVHDELVLEAPESDTARVAGAVSELMASVAELAVPLKVDVGAGPNWAQAHS